MDFGKVEDIERQGFSGFVAVSLLRESACHQVPEVPGVYLVLHPQSQSPIFLDRSTGGHPAVPIQKFQQAWVTGTIVIYIGKATVLRKRLRSYMRFGEGHPTHHHGGRYIWQLADAEHLLVCWKVLADSELAEVVERQLIQEFKARL